MVDKKSALNENRERVYVDGLQRAGTKFDLIGQLNLA